MNWEAIGAIGEAIGAIAVVASLIYLAMQVRHNNALAERDSQQSVLQGEFQLASIMINHADVWNRVLAGDTFTIEEERRQAIVLFNIVMLINANRFYQVKKGHAPEDDVSGYRSILPQLISLPIFYDWRKSIAAMGHTTDFLEMIDSIDAEIQAGGTTHTGP